MDSAAARVVLREIRIVQPPGEEFKYTDILIYFLGIWPVESMVDATTTAQILGWTRHPDTDAVAGVEAQSETVWRQADRYQVPRICYINKMDRIGANFSRTISMIETRLQANPLPIQYPLTSEESFQDVIDIVENKVRRFTNDPDSGPKEIPVPESEKNRITDLR